MYRLAFLGTVLAFFVIVLGAYTRLTDAGLGCPDWPGCYGQLIPKSSDINIQTISGNHSPSIPMDTRKAWTEMIHRYAAGLLGIIILILGIVAIFKRKIKHQPLILPIILVMLVIFQALLGMWTVTLKLLPIIVLAHLLGGMITLALLCWLTLSLNSPSKILIGKEKSKNTLQTLALIALMVLFFQIFLGGWTSANYAALVCLDFPTCQGLWLPPLNFITFFQAFNLLNTGVTGSLGLPLDLNAKMTIHMIHRLGAIFTFLIIGWLALKGTFNKVKKIRTISMILGILLIIQVSLGIANILALLPLPIAVAHNGMAALLLLALVSLNFYLNPNAQVNARDC